MQITNPPSIKNLTVKYETVGAAFKTGWKTTEFYLSAFSCLSALFLVLCHVPALCKLGGVLCSVLAASLYSFSRGLTKRVNQRKEGNVEAEFSRNLETVHRLRANGRNEEADALLLLLSQKTQRKAEEAKEKESE